MSIYSTQDFLNKLSSAESVNDTWSVVNDHFCDLGFDALVFGIVNRNDNSVLGMFTNMHHHWMDEYITEGYANHDPFFAYSMQNTNDFFYSCETAHLLPGSERPVVQKILRESAQYGVRTSVLSAFHNDEQNYTVGFNLGTSLDTEAYLAFIERNKRLILLGTGLAQGFATKLVTSRHDAANWVPINDSIEKLSARELETLNWLANGLRVDAIADKMSISNDTVNFHIRSIKRKLKAKTREHAIAIAFMENFIR